MIVLFSLIARQPAMPEFYCLQCKEFSQIRAYKCSRCRALASGDGDMEGWVRTYKPELVEGQTTWAGTSDKKPVYLCMECALLFRNWLKDYDGNFSLR